MSDEDAAVRLVGVTKRFPGADEPAVEGLDLAVPRGSIVALIGPSGCGKTTTLNIIGGFIPVSSGKLLINGKVVQNDFEARATKDGVVRVTLARRAPGRTWVAWHRSYRRVRKNASNFAHGSAASPYWSSQSSN